MTPAAVKLSNSDPAGADRFMQLAREHYENFPVGSFLVPRAQRVHIHRIYAFARTADDLATGGFSWLRGHRRKDAHEAPIPARKEGRSARTQ